MGAGAAILHRLASGPPVPLHLLALSLAVPGMLLTTAVVIIRSVRWGYALAVVASGIAAGIGALWLMDTHTPITGRLTMATGLVLPSLIVLLLCQRLRRARRRIMLKFLF